MEHFPPVYPFQEDKWFQLCKRLAQRAGFSCDDPESLETVLFRLYADMLGDTVRRLNQTPEKHRRLFRKNSQFFLELLVFTEFLIDDCFQLFIQTPSPP